MNVYVSIWSSKVEQRLTCCPLLAAKKRWAQAHAPPVTPPCVSLEEQAFRRFHDANEGRYTPMPFSLPGARPASFIGPEGTFAGASTACCTCNTSHASHRSYPRTAGLPDWKDGEHHAAPVPYNEAERLALLH
eukprot:14119-Heterococcus_DN1.PRE.1